MGTERMELMYPETRCNYSPVGAHHYTVLMGNIWRCKHCWASMWLPGDWTNAQLFNKDIESLGIQKAYSKWMHYRPKTKKILVKLEEMRMLRELMPEEELVKIIAVIVMERDFEVEDADLPRVKGVKGLTFERIFSSV